MKYLPQAIIGLIIQIIFWDNPIIFLAGALLVVPYSVSNIFDCIETYKKLRELQGKK